MAKITRFTQPARNALSLAHQEAVRLRHSSIGTEHLLLGLIREEGGAGGRILREMGLDAGQIQKIIAGLVGPGSSRGAKIDLSTDTQQVLERAVEEAGRLGHSDIGSGHLLLGLAHHSEGTASEILRRLGVTPENIRRQLQPVLQEGSGEIGAEVERITALPEGTRSEPPGRFALNVYEAALIFSLGVLVGWMIHRR